MEVLGLDFVGAARDALEDRFVDELKTMLAEHSLDISEAALEPSQRGFAYKGAITITGGTEIQVDEFFMSQGNDSASTRKVLTLPRKHWPDFAAAVLSKKLIEPVDVDALADRAGEVREDGKVEYQAPSRTMSGKVLTVFLAFDQPRDATNGEPLRGLPRVTWNWK